jgi:hypothetical protein
VISLGLKNIPVKSYEILVSGNYDRSSIIPNFIGRTLMM